MDEILQIRQKSQIQQIVCVATYIIDLCCFVFYLYRRFYLGINTICDYFSELMPIHLINCRAYNECRIKLDI